MIVKSCWGTDLTVSQGQTAEVLQTFISFTESPALVLILAAITENKEFIGSIEAFARLSVHSKTQQVFSGRKLKFRNQYFCFKCDRLAGLTLLIQKMLYFWNTFNACLLCCFRFPPSISQGCFLCNFFGIRLASGCYFYAHNIAGLTALRTPGQNHRQTDTHRVGWYKTE